MKLINCTTALLLAVTSSVVVATKDVTYPSNHCYLHRGCSNSPADSDSCVWKANTLEMVTRCVVGDSQHLNWDVCKFAPRTGYHTTDQDNDYKFWGDGSPQKGCINPLSVLYAGVRACGQAGLNGLIDSCVRPNSDFGLCICFTKVHRKSIELLDDCFAHGNNNYWYCSKHTKRNEEEELSPPPPPPPTGVKSLAKRYLSHWIRDAGYTFYIDIDNHGTPIYDNGAVGYPLPYFQEFILDHSGVRRCYIMPFSNNIYCIEWLLPKPLKSSPYVQGRYSNAVYGRDLNTDNVATSVTATGTVGSATVSFPPSASMPSACLTCTTTPTEHPSDVHAAQASATAGGSPAPSSTGSRDSTGGHATSGADMARVPSIVYVFLICGVQLFMGLD